MSYKTDIEIAQASAMLPIDEVAEKIGLLPENLEYYGRYKAKISGVNTDVQCGRLILVTAITPTPAGEGKTTISVGLADALVRLGKRVVLTLREPSLGPVFGIKGGAAGGGYAQVVPMEDINLHFTGDFHAIGAANNLLAAMLDNHIHHGNALGIDPRAITWCRCVDMNDRQLRHIVDGLGGRINGVPREDGYDITVASEVMAILCLSDGITDLKERLSRIIVAKSVSGGFVTAGDLNASGAMAALLKDAMKPNLVQTLENTPAIIHGGPFANIAHGCNSVTATRTALALADYVVTEAGFGADLGAEKFVDIKCRASGLRPDACVIVATVRALKHHGGVLKDAYAVPNPGAVAKGCENLSRHVENVVTRYGIPAVVAINRFVTDSDEEISVIREACGRFGVNVVLSEVWEKGGEGGIALAEGTLSLLDGARPDFRFVYPDTLPLKDKIIAVVRDIYGGDVIFEASALKELSSIEDAGMGRLPICVAKTQYSFSDDPKKTGRPDAFTVKVTRVKAQAGAGFVVVYLGDVMTMPGLPKVPSAERIDMDGDGRISGLF